MYEVYYKNQLVTEYLDTDSLDYNDLLNNWKVKINNVLHDCYIKSYRYQDNGVGGLYNGFYYLLAVHDYPEISFEVIKDNSITLKLYTFKDDVYFSDDFDKITFIEKINYIDVVSDCSDMSNILEKISRYCKSQTQYLFDKYSNVNVSFPPSPYSYTDFKFILNNISGYLDVFLYKKYLVGTVDSEKTEKIVSFHIHQDEFFNFFRGIISVFNYNQCNISMKNTTPSVVGGAGQYYSKSEIDVKLNEIKMLIRNISTLPDSQQIINSVLKLDDSQLDIISSQLKVIGMAIVGGK